MMQDRLRRLKLKGKFKELLIPVVREFTQHEIDILVKEAISDYVKQMETVDVIREQRRKNV